MEQLGLFFAVDRNMQQCNYFGKDLGIKILSSFICFSPKLEATQKSMERWMDKQIEVHLYDGILPNSKMDELLIEAMMWMSVKIIMLSERNQTKNTYYLIPNT